MQSATLQHRQAFGLMEVVVFVGIISVFFVVAASLATRTLQLTKLQEHKIIATRHAQEVVEWLKGEKEISANGFLERATATGKTYCINTTLSHAFTSDWRAGQTSPGLCTAYDGVRKAEPLPGEPPLTETAEEIKARIYKREVTLTSKPSVAGGPVDQVVILVKVEWMEGNNAESVVINSTETIL